MLLATATHPDMGSKIICMIVLALFVRFVFKAMFGHYDSPAVPREVRKGRPR